MHFEFRNKLSKILSRKFLFKLRMLLKSSDLTNNIFNERVMYLCHIMMFNSMLTNLSKNQIFSYNLPIYL